MKPIPVPAIVLLLLGSGPTLHAADQNLPDMPMSGMQMNGMSHDAMPSMGANAASDTPATKAYRAASAKMHKDMAIPYRNDADADFAAGMIPHHQGAIDMAKVELQYGTDPELRKLAQDVVAAQEKEIAFMKAWLARKPK